MSVELGRLEENRNAALKSVEETFVNLETCLMKAKEGTLKSVNQLAARKRQLLTEQLDLIKKERSLVDKDVNGKKLSSTLSAQSGFSVSVFFRGNL